MLVLLSLALAAALLPGKRYAIITIMFAFGLVASLTPIVDNSTLLTRPVWFLTAGATLASSRVFRTFGYDLEMMQSYLKYCSDNNIKPSLQGMKEFGLAPQFKYDSAAWNDFQAEDWDYKIKVFQAAGHTSVYLEGLEQVKLKNLYVQYVDKYIQLEPCKIVGMSDTEAFPQNKKFYCMQCDWHDTFSASAVMRKRPRCPSAPESHRVVEDSNALEQDLIDSQYLKLQEVNTTQGHPAVLIPALLKGIEMMWQVKGNERVKPRGLLRLKLVKGKDGERKYKKWFDIVGLDKVDRETDIKLTEEDIKYIKDQMQQPQFYEKLLASFCPHILGMDAFKECALLAIASIKLRRPARILVVSDPAMGKSEILEYTEEVSPNAHYITMANTRYTGLTTTSETDEETGRWTVTLGVLPAAHEGIVCIDEFQVAKEEDIRRLNDVVERGKIRYALAGRGNFGEADANCALFIACNPHEGKVISQTNVQELLKFMGKGTVAFLSRMNLVLFVKDNGIDDEERRIAEHMYKHGAGNDSLDKYEENWTDEKTGTEYFGKQTIRKILYYVVNHVEVEGMPEEFQDILVNYYMDNRTDVTSKVNKLVNRRYMRHVIVLSQILARIKGQSKPNESDIKHVLELLAKNMSTAAFDPQSGEIDPNLLNDNLPTRTLDKMAKQDQLMQAIEKAMLEQDGKTKEKKGYFTVEDIIYQLDIMPNSKWRSDTEIERVLKQMHDDGKLMEKGGQGRFVVVD